MTGTAPVAVVGAGLAGLTAAWTLQQQGLAAVVYEQADWPGGRAASHRDSLAIYDLAAWSMSDSSPGMLELARTLGLADQVAPVPLTVGRPAGGRIVAGRLSEPLGLLRRGVVGLRAALGVRTALADAARPAGPDEPLSAYAARRLHPACTAELLRPLCGLFFLQPPETVSRDAFLGLLAALPRLQLYAMRYGMGSLAAALAARLDVRYGTPVAAVEPGPGGVTLTLAGGGRARHAAAVVATTFPAAADLTGAVLPERALALGRSLPYEPAVIVHLVLRRRLADAAFLVLPPRRDTERLLSGIVVDRLKAPERVAPGYELLSLYLAPERLAELAALPDDALARRCTAALDRLLPGTAAALASFRVQRWRVAGARSDPAYLPTATALAAELAPWQQQTGIFLTGDFLGAANAEGVVQACRRIAAACTAYLRRP